MKKRLLIMALAVAFVLTGCVGVKVVPSGTGSSTANNKSISWTGVTVRKNKEKS